MAKKYLDPKADLTFKRVFGEHKELLISFLNALLPLPQGKEIIDIQYKEKKDFYIVKVKQWVTNQNGDVVTEGIATCMPPKA